MVAPYTGAWIEILWAYQYPDKSPVAPYTGAWIEIISKVDSCVTLIVAPYTGAWIEIIYPLLHLQYITCRSLYRSVD